MHLLRMLVAAIAAAPLAAAAANPLPPPRYAITGPPETGSHLPAKLGTYAVALNRRWADLPPDEQGIIKSYYEAMASGDEPPFPAEGLGTIIGAVVKLCAHRCKNGTVRVVATIDREGVAQTARVLEADQVKVGEFLAQVLLLERYKPAVCKGVPCQMDFPLFIQMK